MSVDVQIPDELMFVIVRLAARKRQSVTQMITELLEAGIAQEEVLSKSRA
jgi:hypothetical protein